MNKLLAIGGLVLGVACAAPAIHAMPLMSHFGGRTMALGDLTFSVYPRIFTPNGDGANDKAAFHFDNPQDLPVQGEIFDLAGAKVADMKAGAGSDPADLLVWDGKDSNGRSVPGGIYLYQVEFQGKQATGTVVVAR